MGFAKGCSPGSDALEGIESRDGQLGVFKLRQLSGLGPTWFRQVACEFHKSKALNVTDWLWPRRPLWSTLLRALVGYGMWPQFYGSIAPERGGSASTAHSPSGTACSYWLHIHKPQNLSCLFLVLVPFRFKWFGFRLSSERLEDISGRVKVYGGRLDMESAEGKGFQDFRA